MQPDPWLTVLLQSEDLTRIVDIGANPIEGPPPYQRLLDLDLAHVTGFEPQPSAFAELQKRHKRNETYLPYAIGAGGRETLRVCRHSGWSSLKKPDPAIINAFNLMPLNAEVLEEIEIDTRRLDDIAEISRLDFLKIDVQGSELDVFVNAQRKLKDAVFIQTEAFFLPAYQGQPLFADIDAFLRSLGFICHCMPAFKNWMIAPAHAINDPNRALNQLVDCDVIYVRNFFDMESLPTAQLKHMALIAHYLVSSFDLALRCICELRRRKEVREDAPELYLKRLQV